jgi:putative MATE family efflux protein
MDFSYKKIWSITFPVLIGMVMEHMLGMTDAIFMGRVGEVEFGASGLGGVYYLVMFIIGIGFAMGAQILMARRNGQGQFRSIGHIFFQGMALLMGLAALLFVLSKAFTPTILRSIISSDAIYEATLSYINWRSFGLFLVFAAAMFRAYFVAITKTKILTLSSVIMVGCNVLFNWVLVFGKFGFPALGIAGAAIGSVLAELVALVFIIVYTRYKTDFRQYGMFRATRLSWGIQRQILGVSSWTMLQYFFSCGTWFFFFLGAEHLGETTLAESNLVRQVASLLYLFVSAFATTGNSLISNLMGAGRADRVMPMCRKIIWICSLCTFPLVLFAAIWPELVMRIYTNSGGLIEGAVPAFMTMLSSYLFATPGYVYFLAISGTGNTRAAMLIEFSILVLYALWVWVTAFVMRADISVVWGVEVMYGALLLAVCYIYMKRARWREKVI